MYVSTEEVLLLGQLLSRNIMKYMKTRRLAAALAAFLATALSAHASFGFADVPLANKIGSGSNKSGLVIDFNDGSTTERYIFQYNWDGAAGTISGAEMLTDVAAGISELSFTLGGGSIADGFYITEIAYDGQSETNGDFATNFDYWGLFIAGGTADGNAIAGAGENIPTTLNGSPVGAGELSFGQPGRFIDNNSWDVWSFGPFESAYTVPEPSAYALFAGVLASFVVVRRRVNRKHS